jgi:hypothetical protein
MSKPNFSANFMIRLSLQSKVFYLIILPNFYIQDFPSFDKKKSVSIAQLSLAGGNPCL